MHNTNAEADYLINYIPIVYNPGYCGSEKRKPQITSAWLTNTNLHLAWKKIFLLFKKKTTSGLFLKFLFRVNKESELF